MSVQRRSGPLPPPQHRHRGYIERGEAGELAAQYQIDGLNGPILQAYYSFSKVLRVTSGTSQPRREHFLDLANTAIERSRAPFDITHAINANGLNHPAFALADQNIGSTTFGRITGTLSQRRLIQFVCTTGFRVPLICGERVSVRSRIPLKRTP